MYRRARVTIVSLALGLSAGNLAISQDLIQPTPPARVTAENEWWYLSGDPITHAGLVYYPAGTQIFFNPNEMVRSGFYMGVPLFSRTTIEPYSVVFVPLAGGRMQPYERPRWGELAGTAGSSTSLLGTSPIGGLVTAVQPQAAGSPTQIAAVIPVEVATAGVTRSPSAQPVATSVGTMGRTTPARRSGSSRAGRAQGHNSIYVDVLNRRWYAAGRAERIDTSRMVRVDDYKGFDVWMDRENWSVIHIPVTPGATFAVPYTTTRR